MRTKLSFAEQNNFRQRKSRKLMAYAALTKKEPSEKGMNQSRLSYVVTFNDFIKDVIL